MLILIIERIGHMKFNVVFKLSKDTIIISEIKKDVDYKSLNNTNVIDVKDLKFSTDYIADNFELVANFLNVVVIKNNITTVQFNNMDVAPSIMNLVNTWEHIKKIYFRPDKKISLELFLKILDNKYIDEINCYSISSYLIERLDVNKNIKVITREDGHYESHFIKENFLESYSDIFYKKVIVISCDLNKLELEEFKAFMAINSRLKVIRIVNYSNELLTLILEELETYKKKNILIQIEEKNNDLNMIFNSVNYMKKYYKKYLEEYNIKFKLNYSDKYKKNNFLKAINIKLFMALIILIGSSVMITVVFNYYQQYVDKEKIEDQLVEIQAILESAESFESVDNNEIDVEYIGKDDLIKTTTTTTKKKSNYVTAYNTNYKQVFEELMKKNDDTVGWLTVNNTKINYPVVQGSTNSYYLKRDFNKNKNSMGWIFMDYRNKVDELDQNTIIYGHNIIQGIMFGTIKNMMDESWYKKSNNQIITFNTPNANMKWQIFSLYKTKATDYYLQNEFESAEDFDKFIGDLKKSSKYDFKVDVSSDAKIITLSTCVTSDTRHVVHAVLLEDKTEADKEEVTTTTKKTTTTSTTTENTTTTLAIE